ncbi:MAG: protein kinase, partial [Chloroflexota bacterium]|nr:protein kinase [Chloroflexota bacterium]
MEEKILNERYHLVELVGTGGMATVYRGHDVLLDRPVAVKMLREPYASDKAFRSRFLAEARAIAKLDHPHIVRIYDLGIDHEHPYLVMELVAGQSLKARIHQEAPFPIPEVLRIGEQICAGVGVAHRAGIVHCDLKP